MSAGNDVAVGSANADSITGFDGDDQLSGAGGDDYLRGDLGQDRLTGGAGADVFAWTSVRESRPKSHDIVLDFSHADGDKIDLSGVDAQAGQGRDNFTFIGEAAFTGGGDYDCELRQQVNGDGTVTLLGDTNQDLKADFAIVIHTDAPLVAADLIL
jgi:Ca2+-binding RTX toxin-like protein